MSVCVFVCMCMCECVCMCVVCHDPSNATWPLLCSLKECVFVYLGCATICPNQIWLNWIIALKMFCAQTHIPVIVDILSTRLSLTRRTHYLSHTLTLYSHICLACSHSLSLSLHLTYSLLPTTACYVVLVHTR